MTTPFLDGRNVRIAIGDIEITAASPLEARRLADALPAALHRAFARPAGGARRPSRSVDRVAAQIASAVAARLESGR